MKLTVPYHASSSTPYRKQLQLLYAFLIGFLMAFATLLLYDRYLIWSVHLEQRSTATEYYRTGYMTALQEMATNEQNLQHQLTNEIRVLCMILTCPKYHRSRAVHVQRTWGKRCTKLLFFSSETDTELNTIAIIDAQDDDHDKLWNKTREAFRYVHEQYMDEYDWFLKADDDTYIIMENLRYMLYAYEPNMPIYFGYKLILNDVEYMSGGASYILSREALRRLVQQSYADDELCPAGEDIGSEDFNMGFCLQNVGVLLADSKFAGIDDEKSKIFPLDLFAYMEPEWNSTIPNWIFEMSAQPISMNLKCCSNYSIAFHYTNPNAFYAFEFLIYHFQAFGLQHSARKLPLKSSLEEVLSIFKKNVSLLVK